MLRHLLCLSISLILATKECIVVVDGAVSSASFNVMSSKIRYESSSSIAFVMNYNLKEKQQQRNYHHRKTKKFLSCRAQSLLTLSAASEGTKESKDIGNLSDLNIPSTLPPISSRTREGNENVSNINDSVKSKQAVKWNVYVCQSNKERSETPIPPISDAFIKLTPPSDDIIISVYSAKFKGGKGPNVRCIEVKDGKEKKENVKALEISSVDSVEKVYRILTKYMGIEGVDPLARDCLKWNYKGNAHLEKGEISDAIESYDKAIATGYTKYEGIILLMRATAYLRRAFNHQSALRDVVSDLASTVPESNNVKTLYEIASKHPSLSGAICQRIIADCKVQDKKFQQTKYRHGLYEYALLHAAQDSLRATELLPNYAKTWLRAGDSLAQLRKLKESVQYYERAVEVDPSLSDTLAPIIERLQESQEFLNKARANGWSEDTLRLALDVAG